MYDDSEFQFGPSFDDAVYMAELTMDSEMSGFDDLPEFEQVNPAAEMQNADEVDCWARQAMANNGFGG